MALQNVRSNTESKRPTAAGLSDGQIAINTHAGSPGLFFEDASGNIVKVGPVQVGTSAPNSTPATGGSTGNSIGELWLDTSNSVNVLKVWDGSAWQDDLVNLASGSNDGLLSSSDFTKLSGIAAGAEVNVATNLGYTGSTRVLTSSTGTDVTLPEVSAGGDSGFLTGADKTKLDGIAAGAEVNTVDSVAGKTGAVSLVKGDVGLGNVDNTSDANKPISTATQTALAGKASLVGGFVPTSEIPSIAITEFLGSVANQTAMLALSGQKGDFCIRTDQGISYVITGDDPTNIANWTSLTNTGANVVSVNNQTGAVTLAASDVGAATTAQGTLADSALQSGANISTLTNDSGYITSADGGNAATLDSIDSTSFLRSDVADAKTTGDLTINDGINLEFGTGGDFAAFHNGNNMFVDFQVSNQSLNIRDSSNSTIFKFEESNANFTADGDVTAFSDIRLKKNIETIADALEKVSQIRGVVYDRVDHVSKRQSGVIAQEVEAVLPEVVHTNEDGIKSVAYGNLAGLLIEAIKELKAEVEHLKGGIN